MPLALSDLADHINLSGGAPASGTQQFREMTRALNTAVQETTRRTGMLDGVTTTVQLMLDRGDPSLQLPYVRLASIGTVLDPGGTVVVPIIADPLAGIVVVGAVAAIGAWSVTCTGKPWPAALETSALDWAAHLYDVQRAKRDPVDEDEPAPSFSLPNRVEEMQRPYLLAGIA